MTLLDLLRACATARLPVDVDIDRSFCPICERSGAHAEDCELWTEIRRLEAERDVAP